MRIYTYYAIMSSGLCPYIGNKSEDIMFTKKHSSHPGLKIIIVGCGKVGRNLVEQLSKEGHDITVIDKKSCYGDTDVQYA